MSAWILVVVFVHQEGVHSLQVPFVTAQACQEAKQQWNAPNDQFRRLRYVEAKCHRTDVR